MTHMKKILSLALVAVLAVSLLGGCVSNAQKLQQLAGTWSVTTAAVEGEAEKLLKSLMGATDRERNAAKKKQAAELRKRSWLWRIWDR